MPILNTITRYYHTVKYLKLTQISNRIFRKIHRPKLFLSAKLNVRNSKKNFIEYIAKRNSLDADYNFTFLNETNQFKDDSNWNDKKWSKLWLYNLHYFDDLNSIDAKEKLGLHVNIVMNWIKTNPPTNGIGWEPYPNSLRIVNLIKWVIKNNIDDEIIINSLALQAQYLFLRLEFHLLGNHLLANAKALLFAGLFFEGIDANKWFSKAKYILDQQLKEQILSDGGHFELSPMYHSIILEDILDCINIMKFYDQDVPVMWYTYAEKMLTWLATMTHPDGEISFFNDAACGIAPNYDELRSYGNRLSIPNNFHEKTIEHLSDSGYIRINKDESVLFIDVAKIGPDYLPGHAHADTLTFEMSIRRQRFLVNSGTSCYGNSTQRYLQRSTQSHNTVVMNDQNSSEVWGGFRVAKRAYVSDISIKNHDENIKISAKHNGYRRLKGKPIHHRQWSIQGKKIIIIDSIKGKGIHEVKCFFHFHPSILIEKIEDTRVILKLPDHKNVIFTVDAGVKIMVKNSYFHPEFGVSIPNLQLIATAINPLPCQITSQFSWE